MEKLPPLELISLNLRVRPVTGGLVGTDLAEKDGQKGLKEEAKGKANDWFQLRALDR